MSVVLEVRDLRTSFLTARGEVRAVDGVSFDLQRGQTLGLVGESGCGKSVTGLSVLKLVPAPGRIVGGQILFGGRDLVPLGTNEMRSIRGSQVSMIFQEPSTSLNPVFTIGNQVREAIALHRDYSRKDLADRAIEMLRLVGIPDPERRAEDYPHQLSGGMKQRVMIAMALACEPQVLIADEPTTALDVTIQAQILDLLRELQQRIGMGLVLITHDLGVVAEMADEVLVMYAGQVVEKASAKDLFKEPSHPYTRGLLASLPAPGKRLVPIPGVVPDLLQLPKGCRFGDRCSSRIAECASREPVLRAVGSGGSKGGSRETRCIRDVSEFSGGPR